MNIAALLFLTLMLTPLGSTTAQSSETGATDLYQSAQRSYFSLKSDAKRINDVNAWRRILNDYRRIIEVYPNDPLVDDILYITAGLYREMYQQFGERTYLESAIDQYQTVLQLYPDSYLQQASLFAVGEIEETHQKAPEKALQTYTALVERFPRGYKTAVARERIERIRRDLNGTATAQNQPKAESQPSTSEPKAETNADATADIQKVAENSASKPVGDMIPVAEKNSVYGTHTAQQRRVGEATIVDIRMSFSKDVGRVAIELDREIDFQYRQLPAPNRSFYFDLKNVNVAKSKLKSDTINVENRYLKRVRIGQHSRGVARLVMDFDDFRDYTVFHLPGPGEHFRIVFDLHRPGNGPRYVSTTGNDASVRPDADIPLGDGADKNSSGRYSIARQLGTKITTVVLDPGHGGKDVGATGFKGLTEAKLNLDIAKRLQKIFASEYPEVTVKLTRDSNSFVSLDTRPAKSKVMEGDIFVSLHSNSARRGKASGIETYYLNFAASDSEAAELAAKENALTSLKQAQLESIVKKITTFSKKEESRELAQFVQKHLYQQTKAVNGAARNRGVKSAPFVVLIGTSVPSVLVEVGFINHQHEGKLLTRADYRDRIARGLFNGIKAYIESLN